MLDDSLVFRYDYEVPIGAVIDYAVSRPDVDPDRIAAIGYSMGGYFVPRAAAFDKRIAACVADCLLPDAYTPMVATMEMNLAGLEDKITCPLLNLSSTGEGKIMYDNARAFFDALPNPRNRFVLTTEDQGAEMHCQRGNSSLLHQVAFDWLDEILAA
jgi:dienelactone hydrolase